MTKLSIATALLALGSSLHAQTAPDFAPTKTYDSVPVTMINPTMYWSASGDFNGDGRADLASVDSFADNVVGYSNILGYTIVLGTADGFSAPVSKTIGLRLTALQAADFNHDGFTDLMAESTTGAVVLMADGTGAFAAPVPVSMGIIPYMGAIADFNADGNPDVVFAGANGHAVVLGTASGTFAPATNFLAAGASYNVLTGDLNNDGKMDFVGTGASFLGNGDGTFQTPQPVGSLNSAQLADFDRDGFPDLASIWTQSAPGESAIFYVSVARGQGNGQFLQYFDWQFRQGVVGLLAADFNQDGLPDLATYDFGAGALRVMSGTGSLVMGGFIDTIPLPSHGGMILADMDGNSSKDIVYSNWRTYSVLRSVHGNPPLLSGLGLSLSSVVAGNPTTATVTLGGPAASATQVTLASSDTNAFFPLGSTLTIPAGASSASAQISTLGVATAIAANITATSGTVTQTARLDIVPAYSLTALSVTPASQYGIFTSTGTVTLSGPADSAAVVALSTNNAALATVPASVTVPAGATSVSFPITLSPVTVNTAVGVSVSLGGLTQNSSVTILKPADSVAISKAIYTVKTAQLKVDATSTSAAATITVYNASTGLLLGTLANTGAGKYSGSMYAALGPNTPITLKSSLGGTVTGAYQFKQ